jgi:F-type H+-transporting ATPase subunit b
MLELNKWFFVLLGNFLILLYLLNIILFKPLIQLFLERKNAIDGSLKTAEELKLRKDELFQLLHRDLGNARDRAKEKFKALRGEGLQRQKDILAETHEKALAMIDDAQKALKQEASKVRERLSAEVEKYSEEIVNKLVKV